MKTFQLRRKYEEKGTRGKLFDQDNFLCHTIERPKSDKDFPCIEEGWYIAEKYYSPANKCVVWLLKDVPGRSMIEFHIANWPHELKGCIAPGKETAVSPTGEPGVSHSSVSFHEFMALTADEDQIAFQIMEDV